MQRNEGGEETDLKERRKKENEREREDEKEKEESLRLVNLIQSNATQSSIQFILQFTHSFIHSFSVQIKPKQTKWQRKAKRDLERRRDELLFVAVVRPFEWMCGLSTNSLRQRGIRWPAIQRLLRRNHRCWPRRWPWRAESTGAGRRRCSRQDRAMR